MTVMSEWLADCSTRTRLRPGKRGHQEYGVESSQPVVRVKRWSAVDAEIHRQLLDKRTRRDKLAQCHESNETPVYIHGLSSVCLGNYKQGLPYCCYDCSSKHGV